MLAHAYNIIIIHGVGSPVHGIDFVGSLNANYKQFLSMLMKNMKLPIVASYDSYMAIHTSIANTDISLASWFQKHLSYPKRAH